MSDTRAVVEEFWARLDAQDASVVDLFADEIEFFAPGDPQHFGWAGLRTRGGANLLEAFNAMWEHTDGRLVGEPKLIVEGEDAVWIARGAHDGLSDASGNTPLMMDIVMHFTVRDGKIVRFYVIEDITSLARGYGLV